MSAATQPHTDERITRLRVQRVLHDFGALLTVTAIDNHSFKVSTPFSFTNGDMYPIMIETRQTGWRITDRGVTIASLARGHRKITDHHIDTIAAIAHAAGFTLSRSHDISADYDHLPTPPNIADFIQVETHISNLLRTTP
jgi:Domain of unknown function DUF1828